jgi:hypothetical protein
MKLINPPVVDSTTTLSIADVDLLVTICPLDQWNRSKINELGYSSARKLMFGIGGKKKFIGWGAQHNLTFEDLVLMTQNFNLTNPQIELIHPDSSVTQIAYEKNFYPQFGWCYNLINFSTIGEVRLRFQMGSKVNIVSQYKVYITDKKLRTRNTLHIKSQWGSIYAKSRNTNYVVKVDQLSYFDPKNPDDCENYASADFDMCVNNELKKIWIPLINCNPPWLTSQDQCKGRMNVTTEKEEQIFNETLETAVGIIYMKNFPAKEKCYKPCTVAQSMIFFNGEDNKKIIFSTFLTLDFINEVVYTTKKLAYGSSEFLIDMGSSLGLWFGLSVFGITDIGIITLKWVNDKRREIRRKYLE